MTKFHDEFPQKDQWVTEASGGTWQRQRAYGGSGRVDCRYTQLGQKLCFLGVGYRSGSWSACRWMRHLSRPCHHQSRETRQPDQAGARLLCARPSKFLPVWCGAHRIRRADDPSLKTLPFGNADGSIVLYVLNGSTMSRPFRIGFHVKQAVPSCRQDRWPLLSGK